MVLFCSIAITRTVYSMKMYNKDLSSCIHFWAANQHSHNFSVNNETVFLDITLKEI